MQNMSQPSQQPRKRKHTKTAKGLAGVCSFLGAIAAIVAIAQFLGISHLPNPFITPVPVPSSTPTPQVTSTYLSLATITPTPVPIHLVACSAASTDAGILKFFTQRGTVVCFSGIGDIDYIIQPVVRVETGTIFATWQYVTISTGDSHHSPQNSPYNCPGKVAHYDGRYMMRVTRIAIVSNSTSC